MVQPIRDQSERGETINDSMICLWVSTVELHSSNDNICTLPTGFHVSLLVLYIEEND